MALTGDIFHLVKKEITLEWRNKYALNGIIIYVISTVFICYLSFKEIIDPATWNALFWIIMLFASVNAVAKSFLQESRGRQLYFYSVLDPHAVILSKILYNILLLSVLAFINLFFYTLFIGNIVENMPLFALSLLLGSAGLAAVMTVISAIAAKAADNAALMAILAFPLILPLLITTIKFSKNAIDGFDFEMNYKYAVILLSIDAMVVALGFLLFPYLWRD
jgi:heme exporter protein B